MALTDLQKEILHSIAGNRSDSSYFAGGLVLNKDWPRRSDDVDIFHDTDEEIGAAARKDIDLLKAAGFRVLVDIEIYGITEVTVSKHEDSTIIQWMSETRSRFFPLVRDDDWGARLHLCDLAVNKVLAASSRSKARDFVDLATIVERLSPLGPLILAAAGKAPHFSPQRTIEEIRRRGFSVADNEFQAIDGLPAELKPRAIREGLVAALEQAELYVARAPVELVGVLASRNGRPVEIETTSENDVDLRRPTAEIEVMPYLPDQSVDWSVKD